MALTFFAGSSEKSQKSRDHEHSSENLADEIGIENIEKQRACHGAKNPEKGQTKENTPIDLSLSDVKKQGRHRRKNEKDQIYPLGCHLFPPCPHGKIDDQCSAAADPKPLKDGGKGGHDKIKPKVHFFLTVSFARPKR